MKNQIEKILVGGKALMVMGSTRHSDDSDYLINDPSRSDAVIKADGADYLNANGFPLFAEVYAQEKGREICSPQGLLELKAYAFAQHCRNAHWQKADNDEYDIKFLVRNFGLTGVKIASKYLDNGAMIEINKIIASVKK